jgi:hypothetical protein
MQCNASLVLGFTPGLNRNQVNARCKAWGLADHEMAFLRHRRPNQTRREEWVSCCILHPLKCEKATFHGWRWQDEYDTQGPSFITIERKLDQSGRQNDDEEPKRAG